MKPRILVACIGNIFLGDDAFGVEVARRLDPRRFPDGVRIVDYGIRGLDLAYALMEDYELVILVDAVPRGEAPGTLYAIEPEIADAGGHAGPFEGHGMNPEKVLAMVRSMGKQPGRVVIVGCEPSQTEESMGLSEPVAAALDRAVEMIESLVDGCAYQAAIAREAI